MYILGVDLGGTTIKVGVVSENFEILYKNAFPTDARGGNDKICSDIAQACKSSAEGFGISLDDISAVGIGVPGIVGRNGIVKNAPNIFMRDFDISTAVSAKLCKPVFALNDANSAALAEATVGAGKGCESAALLTYGTGVGMGIVLGGKVWAGHFGAAGEVGHIVLNLGGKACNCGSKGCYERYAAATALVELAAAAMEENKGSLLWQLCENDISKLGGVTVFKAAKVGDATAVKVLDEYTSCVAGGIVSVINMLDPEVVILGGGIANAGDDFLAPVSAKVMAECFAAKCTPDEKRVICATLGNDAGIIGAALFASQK